MIEIDGPPKAWFEEPDGTKHIYLAYGIGAKTEWECMQAYAQWRMAYEDPTQMLVWRMRPALTHDTGVSTDENGNIVQGESYYKIVCRCVKIPFALIKAPMAYKPDGAQVEMI